MKMRKLAAFAAALMLGTYIPQAVPVVPAEIEALAHSGRTDRSGGHHDNKNKSGLGSYHYHCGGYPAHLHTNGVCPYTSNAAGTSVGTSSTAAGSAEQAQELSVPENISLVFDSVYYADHNPDLYEAFGYDYDKLLNHFLTSGMQEGRCACESFQVNVYRETNPDLVSAFGDDLAAYYEHYMDCGHAEGRCAH